LTSPKNNLQLNHNNPEGENMGTSSFTYSQEALDQVARTERGSERVFADLVDVVDRVSLNADELALALRMRNEGELSDAQFDRALYRLLYKLNEVVDEVESEYHLD
jgi:hypothetical protein